MYAPVRTVAPVAMPVTRDEAKAHLNIDASDNDTLIDGLIAAATDYLDGWTGVLRRCLVTQTWRQDFAGFSRCMRLPLAPVSVVDSVTYLDAAAAVQTVQPADYTLQSDESGAFVRFNNDYAIPGVRAQGPAVSVTYQAGYASIPASLRHAILLSVGHWYENREAVIVGAAVAPLPLAFDALIAPFRRVHV